MFDKKKWWIKRIIIYVLCMGFIALLHIGIIKVGWANLVSIIILVLFDLFWLIIVPMYLAESYKLDKKLVELGKWEQHPMRSDNDKNKAEAKEKMKLWVKRILIYLCWIFLGIGVAFVLKYNGETEMNGMGEWEGPMGWFGFGAIAGFALVYPPYLLIRDKWTPAERAERKEKTRTVMAYCTSFAFAISLHIALGKYNLIGMVEPLVFYGLAWYIPRRYLVKKRLREKAWEKIWEQEDADYPERKENNESRRRLPDRFAKFEIGAGELDSWIKMLSDSDKRERKKEERKKRLQIELCAINKSIKDIETSLYADSFRGEITEQELNILLDEVYRFEYKRRMESDDDDLDDDIDDDWDDELDDDIEDDVDDDD